MNTLSDKAKSENIENNLTLFQKKIANVNSEINRLVFGQEPVIEQIIVSLQMLERITVSISDHSYRDLLNVCDSSMILSEGKIVAKGSKAELLRNEKAIANYFGKGL